MAGRLQYVLIGSICLGLLSGAYAQFTADYQTNIISGVVSNWSGDYIVGSNTAFGFLHIENGGVLSSANGIVGDEAVASNNSAVVSGNGSIWSNSGTLYVGYSSAGNSLTISNGGIVLAQAITLGYLTGSRGSMNLAGGSVTANKIILADTPNTIGTLSASGATLVVSSSAHIGSGGVGVMSLSNCNASVGALDEAGTLTASESILSISGDFTMGDYTAGTVWIIGGQLVATNAGTYVARYANGQIVCSNSLVNLATATVGASSFQTGTLTISGGSLTARQFDIGWAGFGTGAVWVCDGATVTATNDISYVGDSGTGAMTVSNSTVHLAGLTVSRWNPNYDAGTLTVAGGTVTLSKSLTVADLSHSKGTVWVTGGQLIVTNAPSYIGSSGAGQMTVSNGTCVSAETEVGFNSGSQGTLTIAGGTTQVSRLRLGSSVDSTGTIWITGGQLTDTSTFSHIGSLGVGRMTISNGAWQTRRIIVGASRLGTLTIAGGTSSSPEMVVGGDSGTGTVWLTGGQLTVSNDTEIGSVSHGAGQMTISNGIWEAGFTGVGACGTLTVAGGMVNLSGSLFNGNSPNGTSTTWLTGGQLIVTNDRTSIGVVSEGRMIVSNGTWVTRTVLIPDIVVGDNGGGTLIIAGGISRIYSNVTVGILTCKLTGTVIVAGGSLFVTNATHNAVLEIRSGTFTLSGGNVMVDKLVITNSCGRFIHVGGNLVIGSLMLDPNLDADGDGLPNGWEQAHGLDPLTPNADGDPDGDGLSNAQEFSLGTDPNDKSSPYRITNIAREGADIRVTWTTVGGKTNFVQMTLAADASFADSGPATIVVGSGVTMTNYLDAGAATNFLSRFYRIHVVP